ncbi:MAG TPA: hypothetical protein VFR28_11550 [Allosphingosinicella sp.]|nr:hypothetical protein [Allosphingosinicella sp.]
MRILAVVVVASLACTPAFAADEPVPAKEKRICKRGSNLGSHLRASKVCRTAAEWKQIADAEKTAQIKYRNDIRGGIEQSQGTKTGVN